MGSFHTLQIGLFVSLLLNCVSSLYILDSNPLSDIWLKIFLLLYKLPFHLFIFILL